MKPAKEIFEIMKKQGCRQITFSFNKETEMSAILVVDSMPNDSESASGGTRFAHQDADIALQDALNLSRAMTRKCKVLNVKQGGAKAVILANKKKTKKFLQSVGEFIEFQKGLFKTAVDVGFDLKDAKIIASKTKFIDSLSHNMKGLGSTGENTAEGIIHGFEVICEKLLHKKLKDCSIAIQGLGAVGGSLATKLIKKECKVIGTDTNPKVCINFEKIGVKIVKPQEIFNQKVDIFSPCAFGGILDKKTIPMLKCKIVAGGANNPLINEKEGEREILEKGIIFIPDFVINSGGFLQALVERKGGTIQKARNKSKIIAKRVNEIIDFSEKNNLTLLESAIRLFGGK